MHESNAIVLLLLVFPVASVYVDLSNDYGRSRIKRDDGSFLKDTGGPVASESDDDFGNSTPDPQFEAAVAALPPCESMLIKKRPPGQAAVKHPAKNLDNEFEQFKRNYNKQYSSPTEHANRSALFKNHYQRVQLMNRIRRSPYDATLAVGKYADHHHDDFKSTHTGSLPHLATRQADKVSESLLLQRNCPKLNWTSENVIPPVRNQDNCGCCYAMSTADMISSQHQIDNRTNHRVQLSSQWISDCIRSPAAFKCNGGRPVEVLDTLSKHEHWKIPSESCYPYLDRNDTCKRSDHCTDAPPINVKWGKMVNIAGPHEKEFMAAFLQHGPVVALVGVSEYWQAYNGTGIIRPYQCTKDQNHAVLITGYDYTQCVPNYIIKNSWGTDWGGRGYIKLEAGKNTCGIAESVILTCTSEECGNKNVDPVKYALTHSKHPKCLQ